VTKTRLDAIDFWRGVVLSIIFVNHIPGNILGALTPRNFGFSDASEAFVFISGLSIAVAYGRKFGDGRGFSAGKPLIRRAARLYLVHLALTAAAIALLFTASSVSGREWLPEFGCGAACQDPARGVWGFLILAEQISYFNILPLYVVLLVLAPLLLVVGARDRVAMLAASFALYVAGRWFEPALRASPDQAAWYFNPAAWQLMFAMGVFTGLSLPEGGPTHRRSLYWLALLFSMVAAVVVSNAGGLSPGLVDRAGEFLDWNKSSLGTVRIIAFVALAYCIYCSGMTERLRRLSIYPAFSLLGRNALPVFCVASLLSALGQILNECWLASPVLDVVFVAAGLCALLAIAHVLEGRRETRWAAA